MAKNYSKSPTKKPQTKEKPQPNQNTTNKENQLSSVSLGTLSEDSFSKGNLDSRTEHFSKKPHYKGSTCNKVALKMKPLKVGFI